ncbi:hypothetical protein ABB37_06978 [Leptomonas pyrrhocoris]|uniref:Uncharacterized protein n=1 Tax=Leptomonas pyrrhocoris TaxID=157538 RepID=A0A0N0DTK6_LEPPY|nr:hypothetical protein ABB37_06978 [Leptomonas pyrrhocoris]KPA77618.1 hypothetical protein ABB37_06978 [Leptomonas pyrrhocoris]|eukprot:XP_015656057.1 hypothetical protein ABB37_06978 [Leptomonas pyrrhocoris]
MSATDPTAKTVPSQAKKEAEAAKSDTASTAQRDTEKGGSGGGLWGWRSRLMNWRGDGDSGPAEVRTEGAPTTQEDKAEKKEAAATAEGEGSEATSAAGAAPPAPATRPMNIWLRRALERQAESAIAEAIRDGKPIPAVSMPPTTTAAAAVESKKSGPAVDVSRGDDTAAKGTAEGVAPASKVSFADLMRQHREGLLAPAAQPPVKATNVVKKPKAATAAMAVATQHTTEPTGDTATITPTAKKRRSKAAPAAAAAEGKTPKNKGTEEAEAETAAADTAAVHRGAVRKRAKAASALNSASAKRTQDTSAAESASATPTHTVTVKGNNSLEELRALRNRTAGSAHNTPTPGADGAGAADAESTDGYSENALDAISQLLLRYCLGDASASTTAKTAGETSAVHMSTSGPSTAPTTTTINNELAFFNQLMELCEHNCLTAESLELLWKMFQHVRVLRRPAPLDAAAAAAHSSEKAEERSDTKGAPSSAEPEVDAEAYRAAARRREYVQQVIMVVINRLKQLKLNEQQQRRQKHEQEQASAATSTVAQAVADRSNTAAGAAPQLVIGHSMPSIKVGGVPLNPIPTAATTAAGAAATTTTTTTPLAAQRGNPPPSELSYDEQMRRLAGWRSMAEMARGNSAEGEAAAAAALASTMAAYGYPNPYAHLTVFSQHQPVVPPVGWLSAISSPSPYGFAGARPGSNGQGARNSSSNNNCNTSSMSVAARLMPSPFPGAFPIIPPPPPMSSTGRGGSGENANAKEDRETQELFRMIRNQLAQPIQGHNHGTPSTTSPSVVDVSQAERAVLRDVQEDFKQQQRSARGLLSNSPAPPSASTPPSSSLDASEAQDGVPHRTVFVSQGTQQETKGDSPSTLSIIPEEVTGEETPSQLSSVAPAASTTTTTLNLEAKPFVPGKPAASVVPTASADSTPTKTKFNYRAAPFVPGGQLHPNPNPKPNSTTATPPHGRIRYEAAPFEPRTSSNSGSTPSSAAVAPSHMNAHAPAFVPTQKPPASSSHPPSQGSRSSSNHHDSGSLLSANVRCSVPSGAPRTADSAADPWASYEMFAHWRDMMEAYYQGVFASQQTAGTPSALRTPQRYT